ncbi:DUF6234 family protein [Streptomyces sp. HB2AG]|uniref:DUF6234 family protein n=1 Tax=Streptomyces sp. HB2AG TaxID=2983400 RepID=UPI0022A9FE2C|nr:DUF6234 family protein [Streptomyces sp. HB2AG]MCZ2523209.1 DUF6234 family protein [Streptomyces sp. HB2AG]
MGAERAGGPSAGRQAGVAAVLLLIDLMVIAWLLYGYGITGWADGYDDADAPEAPRAALRATWILAGGAAVTGGVLLASRWRVPGAVQLLVLGGGAAMFALLAARP